VVHELLLVDGALLCVLAGALVSARRAWLPRATVALCAVSAVAFWIAGPAGRIATHNVERYEATGRIDTATSAGSAPTPCRRSPGCPWRCTSRRCPGSVAGLRARATAWRARTSLATAHARRWSRLRLPDSRAALESSPAP